MHKLHQHAEHLGVVLVHGDDELAEQGRGAGGFLLGLLNVVAPGC